MNLIDIKRILNATILTKGLNLDIDVRHAVASDLMSDVLNAQVPAELLITGLTNNQTIRTCEIAGINAIVFVRAKTPDPETIRLAETCKIPLLSCELSMFETCGLLYTNGIGVKQS